MEDTLYFKSMTERNRIAKEFKALGRTVKKSSHRNQAFDNCSLEDATSFTGSYFGTLYIIDIS